MFITQLFKNYEDGKVSSEDIEELIAQYDKDMPPNILQAMPVACIKRIKRRTEPFTKKFSWKWENKLVMVADDITPEEAEFIHDLARIDFISFSNYQIHKTLEPDLSKFKMPTTSECNIILTGLILNHELADGQATQFLGDITEEVDRLMQKHYDANLPLLPLLQLIKIHLYKTLIKANDI